MSKVVQRLKMSGQKLLKIGHCCPKIVSTMDELDNKESGVRINPPCVSFKTFFNFIGTLAPEIPARIDRGVWSVYLSGSNGKAVVNAMRFLGMLDQHDAPTKALREYLLSDSDGKLSAFKYIVMRSYSRILNGNISLDNATFDQLRDFFKNTFSITKEDADKCVKFLVDACKYANIRVSAYLMDKGKKKRTIVPKQITVADKIDTDKNLSVQKVVQNDLSKKKDLFDKLPDFDAAWSDELKFAWMKIYETIIISVTKHADS